MPESVYPRNLNINFRKLSKESLTKLTKHYRVETSTTAPKSQPELAALVGRIFDSSLPIENQIIEKFANQHCHADADAGIVGKKRSANQPSLDEPAMLDEQVAAKLSKGSAEEGSWILGNVLDYNHKMQTYEIQDEDDVSRVMTLPACDVKRLDDQSAHLRKGDQVLAVFPETTSFYRATVVKNPKPSTSATDFRDEVVVKFKDDEDNNGKNPARKIPARFVLRRSDIDDSDSSDYD